MKTLTVPQQKFIANLAGERDASSFDPILVARLDEARIGALPIGEVNLVLGALKAIPRKPMAATAKPGYYVTDDGDVFVVVLTKDGERTYAKKLVHPDSRCGAGHGHFNAEGMTYFCDDAAHCDYETRNSRWVYAPGDGSKLAASSPLTLDEAVKLGTMHGCCVICGRRLKDPKSVLASVGPVCQKKLGMYAYAA